MALTLRSEAGPREDREKNTVIPMAERMRGRRDAAPGMRGASCGGRRGGEMFLRWGAARDRDA